MDIPRKEKRIDFVDGMGPDGEWEQEKLEGHVGRDDWN